MSKNRKIPDTSDRRARVDRRGEVLGVIALGGALFLLVAMVSLQGGRMVMGPFGRATAGMFYGLAGVCGYLLIALAATAAVRALLERDPVMPATVTIGAIIGVISLATLIHLAVPSYRVAGHSAGGAIGEHLAEILRAVISTAGTVLLGMIGLVVAIVVATPLRMKDVLRAIHHGLTSVGGAVKAVVVAIARFCSEVFRAILPERDSYDDDVSDDDDDRDELLDVSDDDQISEPVIIERSAPVAAESPRKKKKAQQVTEVDLVVPGPAVAQVVAPSPDDVPPMTQDAKPRGKRARIAMGTSSEATEKKPEAMIVPDEPDDAEPVAASGERAPMIVEPRFKHADRATMAAKEKQADAERQTFIKLGDGEYQLPSIQLLKYDAAEQNAIDKTAMLELSAKLTQTLENYGVKGDVVAIRPGPVDTMYEFAPAPGTRVNKIVNLTDDLALALEALRVRIVAPIPGKAAVGIEVPNKTREKVFLKEILADAAFHKGRSKLPLALGKDIEGGPSVVDLARMPHLLVAGTTGSGKSVAVTAMISSLLYPCSPEDVRIFMVDT
ncbi:MAG: DNA translocase FtsK 4TM domain-containing protein [Kofleriaceae bacterium]